jgi:hypothetical protein
MQASEPFNERRPAMRRYVLASCALLLLAACAASSGIGTTVKYDPFEDKTTALVGDFSLGLRDTMQVLAAVKGREVREPTGVVFLYTIYREANEMAPFDRIFFLIDGERREYPTTGQSREVYSSFTRRNAENLVEHVSLTRLHVWATVPFADFVKMANADALAMRVSSSSFHVPLGWQLVFRQLVAYLRSGGQTPLPSWRPPQGAVVQPQEGGM